MPQGFIKNIKRTDKNSFICALFAALFVGYSFRHEYKLSDVGSTLPQYLKKANVYFFFIVKKYF